MVPKYLFNSLDWINEIKDRILLMLDFDGTLTSIFNNPDDSYVPSETSQILKELKEKVLIAVVSGRDIKTMAKKINFSVDYLCGSHGLEIKGKDLHFKHPEATKMKKLIDKLHKEIIEEFKEYPDILIEKKTFSFAFHYRNVEKKNRRVIVKHFLSIINSFKHYPIKIQKGKMVIEILPKLDWDKGKAIILIMKHLNDSVYPIYVGDDITDEFAFLAIKQKGLTIRIGASNKTEAKYYLKYQREINKFLKIIKEKLNVN